MKIVALDFETANSNHNSACALGMIAVCDDQIVGEKEFLICPPSDDFHYTHIHNITWDMVAEEPPFANFIPEILNFFEDTKYLLAHNAKFDRSVLKSCFAESANYPPNIPFVCTVKLAKRAWPNLPNYKLDTVCSHLGLSLIHI